MAEHARVKAFMILKGAGSNQRDPPFAYFVFYFGFKPFRNKFQIYLTHSIILSPWARGPVVFLFIGKLEGVGSTLDKAKTFFYHLFSLVFLTNFNNFLTYQNFSFWDDFLHTCHLTYLFYDYVKKSQKYLLFDYFSFNWKQVILRT